MTFWGWGGGGGWDVYILILAVHCVQGLPRSAQGGSAHVQW